MRQLLLFAKLFLISSFGFSQNFTDQASVLGVTEIQHFSYGLSNGWSFYDFNEDGFDDLTMPGENGVVKFYINNNGTFNQFSTLSISPGIIRQINWVDYDNDGELDLCISYHNSGVKLYRNLGNFNFSNQTFNAGLSESNIHPYGISFADPDNDNDLDLYISNYDGNTANNKKNQYFENQGDGTFIEKSEELGIDNGVFQTFMATWFDYNNDDLIDLHVINDKENSDDSFYQNNGESFTDVASTIGALNPAQNPMSSSVSDYNNDGFQDVFMTDVGTGSSYLGDPWKNKFLENQNGSSFNDIAFDMGLDTAIFAWGALWIDCNNDGFEDLYIATTLNEETIQEASSFLYLNDNGNAFHNVTDSIIGDITTLSFCPIKGDINNDGLYDIAVLNQNTMPNVLINETVTNNNYIKITPVGLVSNRMAIGAKIQVYSNGLNQYQTVFNSSGICAQNSQHMIFGVDTNTIVDSIVVTFPSGTIARRYDIPVNQTINIFETEYVTANINIANQNDTILICQGDTIEIGTPELTNYLWSNGSTDSILSVTETGEFSFSAFNFNGDTLYESNTIYIHVEESPFFQEIITNTDCSSTNSGAIEIQLINPNDSITPIWSTGDTTFIIDSLTAGIYSYSFNTELGCSFSYTAEIQDAPILNIQYITSDMTDTELGEVSLFVFGGFPPYLFIFNNDTLSIPTIDSLQSGEYTITVFDAMNCSEEISFTIGDQTTSIHESSISIQVAINSNLLIIDGDISDLEKLRVYNIKGELLIVSFIESNSNPEFKNIDFNHPPGTYFLQLEFSHSTERKLLVKNE